MKKKTVTGIELSSYLQLLSTDKESCLLHIKKDSHAGILYMYNGEPYDAQSKCRGEDGQYNLASCEEAVYEMFTWEDPIIEVHPLNQPVKRKILKSLTFLLMESCQRADEQKEKMQRVSHKVTRQTSSATQAPHTTSRVTKNTHENKQTNDNQPPKDTNKTSKTQFDIKDYFPLIDENEQTTTQAGTREEVSSNRPGKQGKKIILIVTLVLVSGLAVLAFLLSNLQDKQDNETSQTTESNQIFPSKPLPIGPPQASEKAFVPATTITQTSPAVTAEKTPEQTDNTKKAAPENTAPQTTVTKQPKLQEKLATAPQKKAKKQKIADTQTNAQTKKQPKATGSTDSPTNITVAETLQRTVTTEQPERKETQLATAPQKESKRQKITDTQTNTQTKKQPEATGSTDSPINIAVAETPPQKTATTAQPKRKEAQLATASQKESKRQKIADTQTNTQTKKQPEATRSTEPPTTITIKKTSPPEIIVDDHNSHKTTGPEQSEARISWQTNKGISSDTATNTNAGITSQTKKTSLKTTNKIHSQRNTGHSEISRAIQDVSHAIDKYKKYPKAARRAGYGGLVKIQIVVDIHGLAIHSALQETSGRKILDAAAMKAAQKLLNKKVTSASLSEDLSIIVPVRFSPQ